MLSSLKKLSPQWADACRGSGERTEGRRIPRAEANRLSGPETESNEFPAATTATP